MIRMGNNQIGIFAPWFWINIQFRLCVPNPIRWFSMVSRYYRGVHLFWISGEGSSICFQTPYFSVYVLQYGYWAPYWNDMMNDHYRIIKSDHL